MSTDNFVLLLEGTGLRQVLGQDGIEGKKTKSNHIMEMADVLGIEAGRVSIVEEIRGVMESHGITVDARHVLLLADTMTFTGKILGNTRHGLVK
jgi:DNA-directed RNA polymerase III subunit RPC1